MLVAEKKHQYTLEEINEVDVSAPVVHPKKKSSIKPLHKVQIIFTILLGCSICIGLLIGYSHIAEAKYKVTLLQKEIKELEVSIENLRVEVDSVQRLDLIEEKAINELGMQYPKKEQMVFLEDTREVAISKSIEDNSPDAQKNLIVEVKEKIQKLIWNWI